jgi:hypothetical protein
VGDAMPVEADMVRVAATYCATSHLEVRLQQFRMPPMQRCGLGCSRERPHAAARSASQPAPMRISLLSDGRRFSSANMPGSCVEGSTW